MDILKMLLSQDVAILTPAAIGGIIVLNQVLRVIMATVRVGVIVSLVTALCTWLPHVR